MYENEKSKAIDTRLNQKKNYLHLLKLFKITVHFLILFFTYFIKHLLYIILQIKKQFLHFFFLNFFTNIF